MRSFHWGNVINVDNRPKVECCNANHHTAPLVATLRCKGDETSDGNLRFIDARKLFRCVIKTSKEFVGMFHFDVQVVEFQEH